MIYTFEYAKTGKRLEIEMPMADAVPFGKSMIYMGEKVVRIPDAGNSPIIRPSVGHVSRALPKWTEGADGYTKTGEPIVENQTTIDRIKSKNPSLNYGDDALAYD